MFRYLIIISYDGTNYAGWQVQKTGNAIQPFLQKAIGIVVRHSIDLTGAGRTDAHVHALGQTAHFDTKLPIHDLHRFLVSVNALLPKDIQIQTIEPVSLEFHARYNAQSKIYHYHLHLDPILSPFTRLYSTPIFGSFCKKKLKEAVPFFLGTHDFIAFAHQAHKGSASHDSIRTIERLEIIEEEGGIRLEFEGDGFLYKMVRNITGTLCDIAQGRIKASSIPSIIASKDRKKAGSCAPPQGLFLVSVNYTKSKK
jgi:tRNA pseudouridine38-40 synthase